MHRASKLALALALVAPGCAGSIPRAEPPPSIETSSLCHFIGSSAVTLRTAEAGFAFVRTYDSLLEGQLVREDALRLRAVSTSDGYRLDGRIDLADDDAFRVRTMTPLSPGVWLAPGALVHVVDATATRAREAELTIGPATYAFDGEVHFTTPPSARVGCSDLGFASGIRDPETMQAERVALGLPSEPPEGELVATRAIPISASPGDAPFATLGPYEHDRSIHVLEAQGELTRVLLHGSGGGILVGWVPTSELSETPSQAGFGLLGAIGGASFDVCLSLTALELFASHEGTTERVGSIDPNVRWIRDETLADGSVAIRPYASSTLSIVEGVTWLVRPDAPIICGRAESEPLSDLLATPAE